MNQQEKELLLKDLCSRLPYGVNCKIFGALVGARVDESHEPSLRMNGIDMDMAWFTDGGRVGYSMVKFKPVLHPITCLTQEITVNGETFVPTERLTEAVNDYYIQEYDKRWKDRFVFRTSNNAFYFERGAYDDYEHVSLIQNSNSQECPKFLLDMLNEWHFNHQLPDHLFVPVTETFNPYKS